MIKVRAIKKNRLKSRIILCVVAIVLSQSFFYCIFLFSTKIYNNSINSEISNNINLLNEKTNNINKAITNNVDILSKIINDYYNIRNKNDISRNMVYALKYSNDLSEIFLADFKNSTFLSFKDTSNKSQYNNNVVCNYGYSDDTMISNDWRDNISPTEWNILKNEVRDANDHSYIKITKDGIYYFKLFNNDTKLIGFKIYSDVLLKYLSISNKYSSALIYDNKILLSTNISIRDSDINTVTNKSFEFKTSSNTYIGVSKELNIPKGFFISILENKNDIYKIKSLIFYYILNSIISTMVFIGLGSLLIISVIVYPINKFKIKLRNNKLSDEYEAEYEELNEIYISFRSLYDNLRKSEKRFSFIMQVGNDIIASYSYSSESKMVELSENYVSLLNLDEKLSNINNNQIAIDDFYKITEDFKISEDMPGTTTYYDNNGKIHAIRHSSVLEDTGVFGIIVDVSDSYNEIIRLKNLSFKDQLTGIYNGSYIKQEGQKILNNHINKCGAMCFFDLDNLKLFNDKYGHEMGDKYIQTMADCLNKISIDKTILPARISGDEFVCLFYDFNSEDDILDIINNFFENRPYVSLPDGTSVQLSMSCGISFSSMENHDITLLMKQADTAMYSIKHTTKGDVGIYTPI